MRILRPGRASLPNALLLLALAGCAHRAKGPGADPFFVNPPPEGVLTPAPTGPGDRPPPRRTASHPQSAPSSAAADTAHLVPVKASAAAASSAPAATAPAVAAPAATAAAAAAPAATAAATAKVGENVHVDELPVAITRVPPQYPEAARAAGTQGTVQLQAFVKTDGTVGDVRVTVSIPGLDEAAKACVRQWTFKPASAAGKPVEAWVGVPVHFVLH